MNKNILNSVKTVLMRNKTDFIVSILLSCFYIGILLIYTHGALFFGGDMPGFYNIFDLNLSSKTSIVYSLFILLSFGNFYVGDYAAAFFIMFLILFFIGKLTKEIVSQFVSNPYIEISSAIAQFLYIIGPMAITESIYSFAGNQIAFDNVFAVIFLLGVVKMFNGLLKSDKISYSSIFAMAVGMAGSLPIFPNSIREFIVEFCIFIYFFLVVIVVKLKNRTTAILADSFTVVIVVKMKNMTSAVKRYAMLFISILFILIAVSLYRFLPIITNFSFYASTASSGAASLGYIGFYSGSFNSLPFSIRLFGSWLFPHTPYFNLYSTMNPVYVLSFLWPFFAIVIPIFFVGKKNLTKLLPFLLFMAIAFFWYDAGNFPLGSVWWSIVDHLPEKYQFIPPGGIGFQLGIVYYVMAALGVVVLSLFLQKKVPKKIKFNRKAVFAAVTVLIMIMLLLSMYPIIDGNAETMVYDSPTNITYFVPAEYNLARDYLMAYLHFNSSAGILILPETYTYISTNWRYEGIALFYNEYFAPLNIVNEFTFGGAYISTANLSIYNNLTQPTIFKGNNSVVNPYFVNLTEQYGIRYILFDCTLVVSNSTMNYYINAIATLVNDKYLVKCVDFGSIYIYRVT